MKRICGLAAIAVIALCGCGTTADTLDLRRLGPGDPIVGRLGYPLGTVVEVTGTVRLDPLDKPVKGGQDAFLQIDSINGAPLPEPLELEMIQRGGPPEHSQRIRAKAVERLMTYGCAKGYKPSPPIQTRYCEYRLVSLIDLCEILDAPAED